MRVASGLIALVLACAWLAATPAVGQPPPDAAPRVAAAAPVEQTYAIDLSTALQLAERRNPTIAVAREAIVENLALQQQADVLLLPTLSAGGNLHVHRGALQQDTGGILNVSAQSLYAGGGAGAVSGGTVGVPAVWMFAPLGDAYLEPLIARQRLAVSQFDAQATANDVLLAVVNRYLALLAAEARVRAEGNAKGEVDALAETVRSFVIVGQARKSDADRAQTRAALVYNEVCRAAEEAAVAAAQLARVLDLDPAVRLQPTAPAIPPVELVDPSCRLESLLQTALRFRPEMAARDAAVALGENRLRQERVRPLLPTLSLGYSAGTFGGGSNLAPAPFDQFNGRSDVDVLAVWTLENAGMGNLAAQRSRRAELDQAVADRARTRDQVWEEVGEAFAAVGARRSQMEVARREAATAASGFREELIRTRGGEGLPIEALNSFDLKLRASLDWIAAVSEYDQAQFRLFVALGGPPAAALTSARELPIAAPP